MRHFRLKSVTIELIILFVAALTLLEIINLGHRYLDRSEALTSLEAIRIADDVAVITSLVEKTPPEERPNRGGAFRGIRSVRVLGGRTMAGTCVSSEPRDESSS